MVSLYQIFRLSRIRLIHCQVEFLNLPRSDSIPTESNILLTFGGYWNEDNRNDVNNWNNNDALEGDLSFDPKRVSKVSPMTNVLRTY